MTFVSPLVVSPSGGEGRFWTLVEDLVYLGVIRSATDLAPARMERLTVAKGTTTDFATVPRFFWRLLPPFGRYLRAATVHDALYGSGGKLVPDIEPLTRKECDELFLRIMLEDRTRKFRAFAMYSAVRIFGGSHWKDGPVG